MSVLFRSLDDLPARFRGGVVSIGNFDGVHLGHSEIIGRLAGLARRVGGPAVVLTFDPHPACLLRPAEAPVPLCWTERKAELLASLGADAVVAYPTTRELLHQEPREFFDEIVVGRLAARGLLEGRNFFFGHHRRGTVELLGQFCGEAGIPLEVVEPKTIGREMVSSSRIRRLIAAGQVDEARHLLGRPHRVRGVVGHGRGRGIRLGYPTANLEQIDVLLPGEGIYAGQARLPSAVRPAALSVGPNPTFDDSAVKVEAFLLDYLGHLYAQPMEIDFLARLRDIIRFASAGELVAQIALDAQQTREIAGQGLSGTP
ncbi:MAG: bifunctional riboflavin kinase/FAD synthetase [Thermoguttaceae bacterium]|jgi:riboflavin kinase/FMN adenylyltransferase